MTRWRHVVVVAATALPLLVVVLMLAAGRGSTTMIWSGLLWLAVTAVMHTLLWHATGGRLGELLAVLDAGSADAARSRVREIKDDIALCRAERDRMAGLLADLSSGLGEGLVVVGSDLRVRLINRVASQFCGVDPVRPGTHLLEIMRDPEVVEMFETAAGGEQWLPVVVENPRGLWEVRAFPVRDGGAVGLMSDVSLTRRAAEFRRRFVQDLSHELRSPLAVLRTTAEALEDELPSKFAELLVRQVERIDRLANELYELASIESGHVELRLESVPLAPVISEIIADFTPEADRASLKLESEVGEGLTCWCDRRGLYRVLSNLVDNAVKYNRRGGWVRVTASALGDRTVIKVADSGAGIPPAEQRAVFQRFYRIERARTPGQGGLGLGLAIVKHMVQHMGGNLAVDSREGLGTTVTLTFPISSDRVRASS